MGGFYDTKMVMIPVHINFKGGSFLKRGNLSYNFSKEREKKKEEEVAHNSSFVLGIQKVVCVGFAGGPHLRGSSTMTLSHGQLTALKVLGTGAIAFCGLYMYFRRRKTIEKSSSLRKMSFSVLNDETCSTVDMESPISATWTSLGLEQPLVIAMCGLPARGKGCNT